MVRIATVLNTTHNLPLVRPFSASICSHPSTFSSFRSLYKYLLKYVIVGGGKISSWPRSTAPKFGWLTPSRLQHHPRVFDSCGRSSTETDNSIKDPWKMTFKLWFLFFLHLYMRYISWVRWWVYLLNKGVWKRRGSKTPPHTWPQMAENFHFAPFLRSRMALQPNFDFIYFAKWALLEPLCFK